MDFGKRIPAARCCQRRGQRGGNLDNRGSQIAPKIDETAASVRRVQALER
jgi:hypothetical protein